MNPEPEVVGYVVYIGTAPGAYTQHIDVGNATEYVLTTPPPGQQYCFAVSAYVRRSHRRRAVAGRVCDHQAERPNLPPTLGNPGDQSSALGAAVSLTLTATDPEGAALTFSATGLPAGLSLASATGTITGSPTQAGTFPVVASVSDGS